MSITEHPCPGRNTVLPSRLWEPDQWYKPIMTVEYLSSEEGWRDWGGSIRLYVQFAMDWNRMMAQRDIVLASRMVPDVSPVRAAEVATVLHALCIRDKEPVPGWVHEHTLPKPGVMLCNPDLVGTGFGEVVKRKAPKVCDYHRVWFEAEMLAS